MLWIYTHIQYTRSGNGRFPSDQKFPAANETAFPWIYRKRITSGAFHSIKNSGFNFGKFSVKNGTVYFVIFEADNLVRYTEISVTYFSGNFRSIWLFFRNFPFSVSPFGNFPIFWKPSQEISIPFITVSEFSIVLVEWKNFLMWSPRKKAQQIGIDINALMEESRFSTCQAERNFKLLNTSSPLNI